MEVDDYDPWRVVGGTRSFSSFMRRTRLETGQEWVPALQAFHDDEDLVLRYDLPGVAVEDLTVQVEGRLLQVFGARRRPEEVPEELSLRDEHVYGGFDRSIVMPEGTDPGSVRATLRDGVLEVRIGHVTRTGVVRIRVARDTSGVEVSRAEPGTS